jgi:hypothetical protein
VIRTNAKQIFGNKKTNKEISMKSVIMTIIAMASLTATAATYVTVQDCNGGESGQQCRTVTYKVRNGQMVAPATQPQGSSSEGTVQTPARYGVPAWLQALNNAAAKNGLVAPAFPGDEAP